MCESSRSVVDAGSWSVLQSKPGRLGPLVEYRPEGVKEIIPAVIHVRCFASNVFLTCTHPDLTALGKTRKSLQASDRPSTKRFESFKHFLSVMSKYFTGRLTDLATYIIGRISEIPRPVPLPYKH